MFRSEMVEYFGDLDLRMGSAWREHRRRHGNMSRPLLDRRARLIPPTSVHKTHCRPPQRARPQVEIEACRYCFEACLIGVCFRRPRPLTDLGIQLKFFRRRRKLRGAPLCFQSFQFRDQFLGAPLRECRHVRRE